ncbi:MAG: transglutaminase family protein, partial [Alphaproteobacteria bacterium]
MGDIEPQEYLQAVGSLPDEGIDIAPAALCLAAHNYSGRSLQRYFHHLKILAQEVGDYHAEMLEAGAEDNTETRLAALKNILAAKHGYIGDSENYDDLQNADLIAVIDRGKGMPIAL